MSAYHCPHCHWRGDDAPEQVEWERFENMYDRGITRERVLVHYCPECDRLVEHTDDTYHGGYEDGNADDDTAD